MRDEEEERRRRKERNLCLLADCAGDTSVGKELSSSSAWHVPTSKEAVTIIGQLGCWRGALTTPAGHEGLCSLLVSASPFVCLRFRDGPTGVAAVKWWLQRWRSVLRERQAP